MSHITRGVVYCAINSIHYLEAAIISASALRSFEPTLPIVIFSNLPETKDIDLSRQEIQITSIQIPPYSRLIRAKNSRFIKISLSSLSPFEETLYLDADILPLQPIPSIWDFLQHGDFAMAVHPCSTLAQTSHVEKEELDYTLALCDKKATQYNGGVILWRNTAKVRVLFSVWKQEWLKFQQQDQLALIRALAVLNFPVIELPKSFNFPRTQFSLEKPQFNSVHLLHWWCGQVQTGHFRKVAQQLLPESTAIALQLGLLPDNSLIPSISSSP
jgi:Glycosyl transferase family 8